MVHKLLDIPTLHQPGISHHLNINMWEVAASILELITSVESNQCICMLKLGSQLRAGSKKYVSLMRSTMCL